MRSISDVLPQSSTLMVSGKEYELHPLTPGDFAKAERHIKDQRVQGFLDSTRHVNLSDSVRAQTMATIECTPVDLGKDILTSIDGQLFLIWLSSKGGGPAMIYDTFRQSLKGEDLTNLTEIVLRITGLLAEPGKDGEDPLGPRDSTTTTAPTAAASIGV